MDMMDKPLNGAGLKTLWELIKANSGAKIATGTYTGTGGYGKSNATSLTFNFPPKLLIIQDETSTTQNTSFFAVNGVATALSLPSGGTAISSSHHLKHTWSGNMVSWYNTSSTQLQLNVSGEIYHYFAIG